MEEACEYGLPRGTHFAARSLELVAVAGRLWISWFVLVWADFLWGKAEGAKRPRPFFAYRQTSLIILRQGRGSEATKAIFCL